MALTATIKTASRILPLLLLPLLPAAGRAQSVTSYTFGATGSSAAAYALLQPTNAPAVRTAGTFDEGYYNNLPIGFSFSFAGTAYTTLSASTNGWMTLGQAISNAQPTNSLSAGLLRPVIAPLWDDLSFGDASTPANPAVDGNLYVQTTGVAGSRICNIEWRNVRWNTAASGPVLSAMVRLYEGSNVVQLVYVQGSSSATGSNRTASVGLAGMAAGNFLSLSDLQLTATASSTTETTTISGRPTSGRTYTFTPAVLSARPGVSQNPLQLAPNPARGQVRLSGPDASGPVLLLDARGRQVRSFRAGAAVLDLGGLSPGLYLVCAGRRTQRLVVE